MTCTNPSRPCHIHDDAEQWRIEMWGTTVHSGWLLGLAGVLIALSTAWGLK